MLNLMLNGTSAFVSTIHACCSTLPPSHWLSTHSTLSHSLQGATYCGPCRSPLFVSSVIGWDELRLCQCLYHLLLNRVQEEGGKRWGGRKELGPLIRLRRRPLSQYSLYRKHQRGSAWHTGKVIMPAGVSLKWTNHCFTWLNIDVHNSTKKWEADFNHFISKDQSIITFDYNILQH